MDNNTGNNKNLNNENEFTHVTQTVKSKRVKRLKKFGLMLAATLICAVVFGLVARVVFELTETPVSKVLGTEKDKSEAVQTGQEDVQRHPISFDNATPKLTPEVKPTAQVSVPAEPSTTPTPTSGQVAETGTDVTAAPTEAVTLMPTKEPVLSLTPNPSTIENTEDGGDDVADIGENSDETASESQEQTGDVLIGDDKTETGEDSVKPADNEDMAVEPSDEEKAWMGYLHMLDSLKGIATEAGKSIVRINAITGGVNWMDENIETTTSHVGTVIAENGIELLILAEYSYVALADRLEIVLADDNAVSAELYAYDPDYNIAVLSIPITDISEDELEHLSFARVGSSDAVEIGAPLVAVGRANGYDDSVSFGVSTCINLKSYNIDGMTELFTTDMQYSTLSEGIVVNSQGELVGYITHGYETAEKNRLFSVVGIDSVKEVVLKLLNGEKLPYAGIRAEEMPGAVLSGMGLENGIYVNEVVSASPAFDAGIRKGDIIFSANDNSVTDMKTYLELLFSVKEGEKLKFKIYRSANKEAPIILADVIIGTK